MEDYGTYSCETKDLKTSAKLTVKEAEKKPTVKLDNNNFQGEAGKPFTIEIPYTSKLDIKCFIKSINNIDLCKQFRELELQMLWQNYFEMDSQFLIKRLISLLKKTKC